jgi:hypothetical protein
MALEEHEWDDLLAAIEEKKCTPFVGAGASVKWIPLGSQISRRWAEKYGYPLNDSDQLSKVAEFLAIEKDDDMASKKILNAELKKINPPNFSLEEFRNTSYAVLADLNLPIYITTNYDLFLEAALQSRGRNPITEFCRWNNYAKEAQVSSVLKDSNYRPQINAPLVYHLHGVVNTPESMVLTEYDYIDFIVSLIKDEKQDLLPPIIRTTLSTTTLLFVGYRLEDINFRVIFQYLLDSLGIRFRSRSIAVLLPPGFAVDKKMQAQQFMDKRAKSMFKTDVYWGDALEFSAELRKRLDDFRHAAQ